MPLAASSRGIAAWPGPTGETVATGFSDAVACGPLYFGEANDRAVVSNDPHFVAVALGLEDLSEVGAYELLTYNHALGSETTIDGVARLFPGERVDLRVESDGEIRLTRGGSNPIRYRNRDLGDEQHMTEAYRALVEGVRRNHVLSDQYETASLGISGGLDSRLTLAAVAEALGTNASALTLDLSDGREAAFARDVALRLGFRHEVVSLGFGGPESLRAGWLLSGGQVSAHKAAEDLLHYRAAGATGDEQRLIVGAWPGDCLIGSYVPIARNMITPRRLRAGVRVWARNRGRQWISAEAGEMKGPTVRAIIRRSRNRLRDAVLASDGGTAAQKISYWAMYRRQPTFSYIAPSVLTTHILSITPVLAPGYLDRLMELSALDIVGKNYYRRLIHANAPTLRDIPTAATGAPISTARVVPSWLPSAYDLFALAPPLVRNWARKVYRLFVTTNPTSGAHWRSVLLGEFGSTRDLKFGNAVFNFARASDTQVLGNALALWWTRRYLAAAKVELQERP
jgi:hypothetical protein